MVVKVNTWRGVQDFYIFLVDWVESKFIVGFYGVWTRGVLIFSARNRKLTILYFATFRFGRFPVLGPGPQNPFFADIRTLGPLGAS